MWQLRKIAQSIKNSSARRALIFVTASTLALIALFVANLPAAAQSGPIHTESLVNIVLVHGAWADGSSWGPVIERLQKEGYNVTAPQLPETSLAADVARVREVLAAQSGPTILVAHSYGGEVISALGADAPNVVGEVYVAAFALDEGESLGALQAQGPPMPSAAAIQPDAQGFLYMSQDGFLKYFAPDIDPAQAKVLYATQQPPAAGIFAEQIVGAPSWKKLPTWYLVTTDDQMVTPAAQLALAQRMGATISTVASSHVAMLSHPDVVANLIMSAAQAVNGGAPTIQQATPVAQVSPEPQITPEPRPNTQVGPDGSLTFGPTGKTISGKFLAYWDANGGLTQFGYPISNEITEVSPVDGKSYTVQYFQRAEFELHPESPAPYDVQLSLLGSMRYKALYDGK